MTARQILESCLIELSK
jgi:hypothetical protein